MNPNQIIKKLEKKIASAASTVEKEFLQNHAKFVKEIEKLNLSSVEFRQIIKTQLAGIVSLKI